MLDQDKVRGMFMGLVIGDALGMPHEFCRKKNQGLDEFSENLIPTTYNNQYQGRRSTVAGQGSDDSEMTFTLWSSIRDNKGVYDKDKVVLNYMKFAEHSSFLGKNTVALFKGVKTLRGYKGRCEKVFAEGSSQSNGSLMRISPLALIANSPDEIYKLVLLDTGLTNPNNFNYSIGFVYLLVLCCLLRNEKFDMNKIIDEAISRWPDTREILESLNLEQLPDVRDEKKGWVRHAAHIAFYLLRKAMNHKGTFRSLIRESICMGGDTDTNGAISGVLLGAYFGYDELCKDKITKENIDIILNSDTNKGNYPKPDFMSFKSIQYLFIDKE